MSHKDTDDTEIVSDKMEHLIIAQQNDQKQVDKILGELDEKIRDAEKRLSNAEMKRSHSAEIERKMEEKVRIAKTKVEESYQRMKRLEHVNTEQQSKTKDMESQLKELNEAKASYTQKFMDEIMNIKNKLVELRVDPLNYHPDEDVVAVEQETAWLEEERQKISGDCDRIRQQIAALQALKPVYPADLSQDQAAQIIDDLEFENRWAKILVRDKKNELKRWQSETIASTSA